MGNNAARESPGRDDDNEAVIHGLSYLSESQRKAWRKQTKHKSAHRQPAVVAQTRSQASHGRTSNGQLVNGHGSEVRVDSANTETPVSLRAGHAPACDRTDGVDEGCVDEGCVEWLNHRSYPYENVVMSGGGSKGYAFVGALKALEDCGLLTQIKRVAGSSAGAICAGLLAVGCSPQEIADVFKCDIKWLFQDQQCAMCCMLPRVCRKYGVHPGKRFSKIYGQHIANKVGNPDITFKQLYEKHGKELCIVVTNLSRMCSEYCHPKTTPDLPIRTAVRMSMSFPLVYKAVKCELNGRVSLYTDGGMLDQYPIHCYDGSSLDMNENTQEEDHGEISDLKFNDKSLGLYVISEKAIDYKIWQELFERDIPYKATYLPNTKLARARLKMEVDQRKRTSANFDKKEFLNQLRESGMSGEELDSLAHYEISNKSQVDISNFGDYFVTAIETLLVSQRKRHIKPCDYWRTVGINCGYIGTNDYDIEPGDREFMIRQGYAHTRRYLRDFIEHKVKGTYLPNSRRTLRRTQTVPANICTSQMTRSPVLRRTLSTVETQV